MNDTRTAASKHLPPLRDIIEMLRATDVDSWWEGPTFRSPDGTKHCVLSHVFEAYGSDGFMDFEERYATSFYIGAEINDKPSQRYPQAHPKDRVIAYLEAMERGDEMTTHESMDAEMIASSIVYVAGPMSGRPDFNYPAFEAAAVALRAKGYRVFSPHEIDDDVPGSKPYEWYIEAGLAKLRQCNTVALLPGWEDSKGVSIELKYARGEGMAIFEIEVLLQ